MRMLMILLALACLAADRAPDWVDDFDYTGLPDPKKWDYEEGFVRNNESQYYTRARLQNARVEEGCLIIEGRKERFANAKYKAGSRNFAESREFADYTSASVITKGNMTFEYGRLEVRAKVPQGLGTWPAIWMLGANHDEVGWPACGEIDIMEFLGHTPNKIWGTVHFAATQPVGTKKKTSIGRTIAADKPWEDFHIYAIDWTAQRIDISYDGKIYNQIPLASTAMSDGRSPFRRPQYLLLNLALGGSWGKKIDDSQLPQRFMIDYVKYYKLEKPAEPIPAPPK